MLGGSTGVMLYEKTQHPCPCEMENQGRPPTSGSKVATVQTSPSPSHLALPLHLRADSPAQVLLAFIRKSSIAFFLLSSSISFFPYILHVPVINVSRYDMPLLRKHPTLWITNLQTPGCCAKGPSGKVISLFI